MTTIKPPALRKGDKIGVISPSEPIIYKKKFRAGIETLKKIGFQVVLGKNVYKRYGSYLAGTDKERLEDLNAMIRDKSVKGIFFSRGGFNLNRILNLIDYRAIERNPKIFAGFSDITALINAVHKKTGLITFHCQNVEFGFAQGFSGKNKYTFEYLEKALMRKKPIGEIKPWRKFEVIKNGTARGKLIGGNLSVLLTLIGAPYEPNWQDKILFWEEIQRTHQELDFYLAHLRLCGALSKISGMIIGKLVDCDILRSDDDWGKKKALSINKIILEICKDYKFPIIKGVAFGHYYPQITIPVGVKATVDTYKKLFSVDESGVK